MDYSMCMILTVRSNKLMDNGRPYASISKPTRAKAFEVADTQISYPSTIAVYVYDFNGNLIRALLKDPTPENSSLFSRVPS